jgi:hypothetical protein
MYRLCHRRAGWAEAVRPAAGVLRGCGRPLLAVVASGAEATAAGRAETVSAAVASHGALALDACIDSEWWVRDNS